MLVKETSDYGAYNYNMVQRILDKGWDTIEEPIQEDIELPYHANIRGGNYYK